MSARKWATSATVAVVVLVAATAYFSAKAHASYLDALQ
jgi:hypothetical protein